MKRCVDISCVALVLGGLLTGGLTAESADTDIRGPNHRRLYSASTEQVPSSSSNGLESPFQVSASPFTTAVFSASPHTRRTLHCTADRSVFRRLASGQAGEFELPLPGGGLADVVISKRICRSATTVTLVGKIRHELLSEVILVWHDGIVNGFVHNYRKGQYIEVQVNESGEADIREMDPASYTERCACANQDPGPEPGLDLATVPSSAGADSLALEPGTTGVGATTMDIVVGYGREARQAEGGVAAMEARIIASIDRMNTAFSNSGITGVELVLLATIEDPDYDYPGAVSGSMGSSDELGDLNNHGDGVLDTVSQLRIDLGADLNAFIINGTDGSAGVAYRPGRSSITARTYMSSTRITFVHEIGHNIGCRHSWGDSDCGTSGHNYGLRIQSGGSKYRTVMAYDWGWLRIPYFSNPDILYAGVLTGRTNGTDVTGDGSTDSRYLTGGYSGDCTGSGMDGTNPNLGANNAQYIMDNAAFVEDNAVRTALGIVTPSAGSSTTPGQVLNISWTGGIGSDSVQLDLYQGGVSNQPIAAGLSNLTRSHAWTVPGGLSGASDYQIRITLNGSSTADGGTFSVYESFLQVTPGELTITHTVGTNPGNQQIDITNIGIPGSVMNYSISTNAPWLSVSPSSGSSTGEVDSVTVTFATDALAVGDYSAAITVTAAAAGGSPAVVPVECSVLPLPPVPQGLPYFEDFSSLLPDYSDGWEYDSTEEGRIQISSGQLQMDDSISGSAYSRNEAVLHLDLDGQDRVYLHFDHQDYSDEDTAMPATFTGSVDADGVAISADGSNWVTLLSLTSSFTSLVIDLDAAAQSAGLTYTDDFQIKFQQYDNYSISTDGRGFDNIAVTRPPTMAVDSGEQADVLSVDIQTLPGFQYVLQCRTNLMSGDWFNVSTNIGDGSIQQIIESNQLPRAYYQIQISAP